MTSSETVFVFRIGQLGDSLVALPAIRAVREKHPEAELVLITNVPAQVKYVTAWDVYQHTGYFAAVIYYDTTVSGLLRLAMGIRKSLHRSVLYYLAPSRSGKQLARDLFYFRHVCGIRKCFGADKANNAEQIQRDARGALLTLQNEAERLLGIVDREAPMPKPPLLLPPETAQRQVDCLLRRCGSQALVVSASARPGAFFIGLGIGSKMPAKKWYLERYVEIARRVLSKRLDAVLLLLGGKEDYEEGEQLRAGCGHSDRVINLAGQTNIMESAAALARCRCYVGNDTGTMHLSAMMGIPCVAIFSSRSNPGKWEPYHQGHVVLRKNIECSGCNIVDCIEKKKECLDLISVDEVWVALEGLLSIAPVDPAPECRGANLKIGDGGS